MNNFAEMNEDDLENYAAIAMKKLLEHIHFALQGEYLSAFGEDSVGYWGANKQTLYFEITAIEPYTHSCYTSYSEATQQRESLLRTSINLFLKNYSTDEDYGMIYTDQKAQAWLEKTFSDLLGEALYDIGFSEQGMQGINFINIDISIKAKALIPEYEQWKQTKMTKLKI